MAKTVMVELGGKSYEVRQLPVGLSKAWREAFAGKIESLIGTVQATGEMMQVSLTDGAQLGRSVAQLGSLLMSNVGPTLLGSVDLMLGMVAAYCPEIKGDLKRIELEAFDDEVMGAFVEVVKLAYPFGGILELVRGGRVNQETKRN